MRDPRATMPAAAWLRRHAPLIAQSSRVLDLAAGQGRNARFLAALGHDVVAVDRDADALVRARRRSARGGARARPRDAVVAARRASVSTRSSSTTTCTGRRSTRCSAALSDSGVLIYETFAAGNEAFGRPSNPAFPARRRQLLERTRGRLAVVSYEEGRVDREGGSAVIQRLVGGRAALREAVAASRARDAGAEW